MAEDTAREIVRAGLVIGAFLLGRELVGVLKAPTVGPRLRPGELRGSRASELAEEAYWQAEQAAYGGQCAVAKGHFIVGEFRRGMLERRTERGDRTGRDVKPNWRAARKAIRRCEEGRV